MQALAEWLGQYPGLAGKVTAPQPDAKPGQLGPGLDALAIAVGSGGALTVLARGLVAWAATAASELDIFYVQASRPGGVKLTVELRNVTDAEAVLRQVLGTGSERRGLAGCVLPNPDSSRVVLDGRGHRHGRLFWEMQKQIPEPTCSLRDLLTSRARGGFKPEHCHLISNPSDVKLLDDHLVDIAPVKQKMSCSSTSPGTASSTWENVSSTCAWPTPIPTRIYYTGFAVRRIRAAFEQSDAKIKILVLDCCAAGPYPK